MPEGSFAAHHLATEEGTNEQLHHRLARADEKRFDPALPTADWKGDIDELAEFLREEGEFLEAFRASVAGRAAEAPTDPDGFIAWFEALEHDDPGQNDPLFPWLAEQASMDEMRWFLT